MPAKVILTITRGPLSGQTFSFEEHTTRLLGRDTDCDPRLPDDQDHRTISRHHCLLEINPPAIRVRDFGSRNGTFVNGTKIGSRQPNQRPEEVDHSSFPEVDLQDGDTLALAPDHTVFQVQIAFPRCCADCGRELDEAEITTQVGNGASGEVWCATCREIREQQKQQGPLKPWRCASCGETLPPVTSAHQTREVVCAACRANPQRLAQHLLAQAAQGQESLCDIQGYTLLREIGRGGMGAVYLARHEDTGEQVALKVMLPKGKATEQAIAAFLREIEVTYALQHRNLVKLRAWGYAAGVFFFTLDYCTSGSLHDRLRPRGGSLPIDEAYGYILQALDGLHYAHTASLQARQADGTMRLVTGVVHRDIKPANLLLAGSDHVPVVKVGDFGIAKAFELAGLSGMTRTGDIFGTVRYMPQQSVIDFKYARPAVDVWAMAATLYELLTGTVPRDFPPGCEPFLVVLRQKAVPICQRNPKIPPRLAEVIDHALHDRPAIGYQTAMEFKRALEGAMS
ncbi:MAG TPA: protein kinase [Ktedonobacteraceae bacterium]|nr:protein kinase [Ktedonobacteraceae bacterium]